MCIELIICVIIIGVLVYLFMNYSKSNEGYSSLNDNNSEYYLWRTYSSNPFDYKRLTSYPYDYYPYEYKQRFNCYNPHDIYYGQGLW